MSSCRLILGVPIIAVLMAGCATTQARTEPVAMPELVPPPPPPRVVETYPEEAPIAAEATVPDATNSTPAARNSTRPQVPQPKPDTTPKPEPAPTQPEKPAVQPQPQPPALTLKPTPGSESTTEGSIRRLINNANRDLARVNYGLLNQDGKAQYDTAKRFMQQAEDALRSGNLVFAGKLADKAATMAAVLVR